MIFALFLFSCVSTNPYAKAEKDLCDCLSGIKAPADEFCSEWNQRLYDEKEKLDQKMNRLARIRPGKFIRLQREMDKIKVERDTCMKRISRCYPS